MRVPLFNRHVRLRCVLATLASALFCGCTGFLKPETPAGLLRRVYDDFQGKGPVYEAAIRRNRSFIRLLRRHDAESVVRCYDVEPQVQPFIVEFIKLKEDRRFVVGLIERLDDSPRDVVFYSLGTTGQVIDVHAEIGEALARLTGADLGSDQRAWTDWWSRNVGTFTKQVEW